MLAFTGVPQTQLAPERGAANGRYDEVYRTLVALKARAAHLACAAASAAHDADTDAPTSSSAPPCAELLDAVVLVECVVDRVHIGVAPVLIDGARLSALRCADECDGVAQFAAWAHDAPCLPDCVAALDWALDTLYTSVHRFASGAVHVFASDEEMPTDGEHAAVYVPSARGETDARVEWIARLVGSPIGWAQHIECERMPLLAAALARRGCDLLPKRVVSLGATRLRASQVVALSDDALSRRGAQSAQRHPIPRVAFYVELGVQTAESATLMAHHFLVEVMWLERRKDTPRHHVTLTWHERAAGCGDGDDAHDAAAAVAASMSVSEITVARKATIPALALETLRGDAELRQERVERGVGGAAAASTYAAAIAQLLSAPAVAPSPGVRIAVRAQCDTRARLEHFTARCVEWQLRWLYRNHDAHDLPDALTDYCVA